MLRVGLDLSRTRLDFCVLDERGERVEVGAAPPDGDGLRGFARRVELRHGPVAVRAAIESMNGAGPSQRTPFPAWASYRKHSIWIYDVTQFQRCRNTWAVVIMDLVTRKWITEIVSAEETGLQVQLAFTHALEIEGLLPVIGPAKTGWRTRRSRTRRCRCCSPSATTGRR